MFPVVAPASTLRGRQRRLLSSLCHQLPLPTTYGDESLSHWPLVPRIFVKSVIVRLYSICNFLSISHSGFCDHPLICLFFRLVYPCSKQWPHWFICLACLYPFFYCSLYFPGQLCLSYFPLTLQLSWLSAEYIFGLPETPFWIFHTTLLCVSVISGFRNLSWIILVERTLSNFIVISSKRTYRH